MTAGERDGLLVGFRLDGELAASFLRFRDENGFSGNSDAARRLFEIALGSREAVPFREELRSLRAASSSSAKLSAASLVMQAIRTAPETLDVSFLTAGQLAELCLAAGAVLATRKGAGLADALSAARREVRRAHVGDGTSELLDFMASVDSRLVFDALDPRDLEAWITSMFAYRRGLGDESLRDFDYEVGRHSLLALLERMGIRTRSDAEEKFRGGWVFSKDSGWKRLSAEGLRSFVSADVSEWTDAFDPLDPNPGNYSPTGIADGDDQREHERWTNHGNEKEAFRR